MKRLILTSAITCLLFTVTANANVESVGDKVKIGETTVRVDRTKDGGSVRPDRNTGPSINVRTESRSMDNKQGDVKATIGVTIETK